MASKRSKYELELDLELQRLKEETQKVIAERQKIEHKLHVKKSLRCSEKKKLS